MIVSRRLLTARLALVAVVASTASAHADPLDQAAANVAYAQYVEGPFSASTDSPNNVTCSNPIVHASEIVPHEDLIFAETHQSDQLFGTATCANLSGPQFRETSSPDRLLRPNRAADGRAGCQTHDYSGTYGG